MKRNPSSRTHRYGGGVTLIDAAPVYGIARSQRFIGKALPGRQLPQTQLATSGQQRFVADVFQSRAVLNVSAAGASATIDVAVMGPTPEIVVNRRATGSSIARRAISVRPGPRYFRPDLMAAIRTLKIAGSGFFLVLAEEP